MKENEPLKPCPFCGREPRRMDRACAPDVGHEWIWFASCPCDGYSANAHQHAYSPEELAKRWNTRPIEDALRARITELEEEKARRVAAQEAITSHWEPKVAELEAQVARLKADNEKLYRQATDWPDEQGS